MVTFMAALGCAHLRHHERMRHHNLMRHHERIPHTATYAKIKPKQQRLGLILNGDPDWIRTNDTKFRKLVLYPLSYEAIYMYCIMLTCTARLTQRACLQLFLKRALKPIHKRRLICMLMFNVVRIFIKQLIHLF